MNENTESDSKKIELERNFKLAVYAVCLFIVLSFVIMIYLSFQEPLNTSQTKIINNCDFMIKTGFGALVGLLGGKTI